MDVYRENTKKDPLGLSSFLEELLIPWTYRHKDKSMAEAIKPSSGLGTRDRHGRVSEERSQSLCVRSGNLLIAY